jgi:hypothetical protein
MTNMDRAREVLRKISEEHWCQDCRIDWEDAWLQERVAEVLDEMESDK